MAITHFTPTRVYTTTAAPINPIAGSTATVTTATTPVTLTTANVLAGLLRIDTQDIGTAKWPTAANLAAAIQGVAVGTAVDLVILNVGDSTLTVAINTGGTLATGATATQATVTGKRWMAIFTNVTAGSEAYTLYSLGAASAY